MNSAVSRVRHVACGFAGRLGQNVGLESVYSRGRRGPSTCLRPVDTRVQHGRLPRRLGFGYARWAAAAARARSIPELRFAAHCTAARAGSCEQEQSARREHSRKGSSPCDPEADGESTPPMGYRRPINQVGNSCWLVPRQYRGSPGARTEPATDGAPGCPGPPTDSSGNSYPRDRLLAGSPQHRIHKRLMGFRPADSALAKLL